MVGEAVIGRAAVGVGGRVLARGALAALGPVGWVALGALTLYDGYQIYNMVTESSEDNSESKLKDAPIADACTTGTCPCERNVVISGTASPQAAQHIVDAQAMGKPSILTYDPSGTGARRSVALRGIPTVPGMDRDEYPPATFAEGGAGASVRHIPASDNRSAGGQMAAQMAGATPGCKITMTVGP